MSQRKSSSYDLVTVAAVTVATAVTTIGACVALLGVKLNNRRKKFNTPQPVFTTNTYPPRGHYSQAITHRGKLYVSGLLPATKDGTKMCGELFSEQVQCVLCNLREILAAGGSCPEKLVHVRVFISDVQNWSEFDEAWAKFCGEDTRPARTVVMVPALHYGVGLELEAIAAL